MCRPMCRGRSQRALPGSPQIGSGRSSGVRVGDGAATRLVCEFRPGVTGRDTRSQAVRPRTGKS